MSHFKKGIACALAVLLLITTMPIISFAAPVAVDGQTIALGETLVVEITEPYQVVRLYFTPEISGLYEFRSFDNNGDPVGYIADATEYGIFAEGDDNGGGSNFKVSCFMGAGETYTLGAKMWSANTGSYSVCIAEQSEFEYSVYDGENATITGYNGVGGEVTIPSTLDDYPVTGIGFDAFYGCDTLTAVEIPDMVTDVVYHAFAYCDQLAEVYLPTSLETIQEQAFEGCSNLKTVFYSGSKSDRENNLWIGYDNWYLESAKWVYNSCSLGEHEFDGADDVTCNNCPYTLPVYYPIELDETQSVTIVSEGDEMLFRFTPTVTGAYSFFSFNNTVDSYGYIADANGYELVSDDDGGQGSNFNATCLLEAGQTYTLGARCLSDTTTGTFEVKVQQFEIVSVDFHDVEIIAGANTESREIYDYETDSYVEWEYYPSWLYETSYTVTLQDGSTVEGFGDVCVGDMEYDTQYMSEQDYLTPWMPGGKYTATGRVLDGVLEDTFTVTLVESPVVSVTVPKRQLIENQNGYYTTDSYYDENNGWVQTPEYFYYDSYGPQSMVFTLKDGTVVEGYDFEWNGQWYSVQTYGNQSYQNRWTPGNTYEVEASIAGYDFTYEVEIIGSPVASVTIPKVILIEGLDGNYQIDGYYGPDGYVPTSPEYFWYHYGARDFVVTMNDGTVYENQGIPWGDSYYSLNCSADQSYENRWTVGNTYTATAEICGFVTTYEIEIVENPIETIIVEPQQHVEHTNGRWTTDWISGVPGGPVQDSAEYFEYWVNPDSYTVVFKDGTTRTVRTGDGVEINGVRYYLDWGSDQSYDNQWGIGTHTAWARLCGVTTEYTVEITQLAANDQFEYTVSNGGVIITDSYVYDVETLEIPAEIDGKPVIGVAGLCWSDTTRHLIFPDSVRTIGDYLLSYFWNLETVTFGSGVNNLTPEMFYENRWLESIVVSEDNPYFCVGEDGVLYNKDMDTFIAYPRAMGNTYLVPATVTNTDALSAWCYEHLNVYFAEDHAGFVTIDGVTYTADMTKVVICAKDKEGVYIMPDTVTEIADSAFENCDSLTEVVISPSVTSIVYYAFASCDSLASVELPDGLVSIDQSAFEDTPALTSIALPSMLEYIGESAFAYSGLTALTVPDSVRTIDFCAFEGSAIEDLDLGEGVEAIGSRAFAYTPVKAVVLPSSLTTVGSSVFEGCYALQSADLGPTLTSVPWSMFADSALPYIALPENITSVEPYAFAWSDLADIDFSSTLTTIEADAFNGTRLTQVVLPASVDYVGQGAFRYSDLEQVEFKNPAVYIEDYAFYYCPLKSLQLGDEMERVGMYTFAGTDITEIDIPDSVTSIVYGAFADCEFLADIRIPTTVEDIGGHTFDNTAWYNAQADGVTYLGHIAYNWKGEMAEDTTVAVQEGTTVIADYAFEDQVNMTEIALPSTLRVIGEYAFYGCTGLKAIHIPANVVEIGYSAFAGCVSVESLTVDPANEYYTMIDGALYTTDGSLVWDPAQARTVISLYVDSTPYKTVYNYGEEFDPTGMSGCVYYSGWFSQWVTDGFTVEGFDSTKPGTQWVKVSYGGYISGTEFSITVLDNGTTDPDVPVEPDVTLQSIEISSYPNKMVYKVGEAFDPTGLVLDLYYSDGSREVIESGYTIEGFDSSVPGDCWPHISYGGCTIYKAFRVVVEDNSEPDEPTITDIRVYPSTENGLALGVTYSDGTTQIVAEGFTVTGFDPAAVGVQEVTVTYNGFTKVFHLIVNEQPPVEIETILVDPDASNGLKVTVVYSDGTTEDITSGYTVTGFDPTAMGDQEITVTYQGITKTFTVKVADAPVVGENEPTFVVDDATAKAGDTFTVAVRTQNNPGITSLKLAVGYDSEILEFVSIEWKDFTGGVTGTSPTDSNPFIINWTDTLSGNNTINGTVALLTFKVKDGAATGSTTLSLSYDADDVYDVNYDNVTFATVDGTVNIIEYISGDVNDDTKVNNKDLGMLLQYLNNWDVDVVELACDVNRDGKINNKDLGILLQYLNNWDVELK